MVAHNEKPVLYCKTQVEWRDWLANTDSAGVRLQLVKKSSSLPGISYAQAVDEALCVGWIDGQASSLDADFYLQSFTLRRPRSSWSQINRGHVARLISEGRMRPSGLAQIDAAKADGRWEVAILEPGEAVHPQKL